jgi:hypothetical protein
MVALPKPDAAALGKRPHAVNPLLQFCSNRC